MDNQDVRCLRRTLYKNARFDAVSTTERSRRRTEIQRKEGRDRDIQQRRKIEPSPAAQPAVKTELTRREKLLRWKAEKEAILLAEKAKKKPPFKVGAFPGLVAKDPSSLQLPKSTKKPVKELVTAPKKQTAATVALAALSNISDKRITRSQAKLTTQTTQIKQNKNPVMSKRNKTGSKTAGAQKPGLEVSFAPANHVFKAPVNLTFPVTPDLMKRTRRPILNQSKTMSNLLAVPGVKPLNPSKLLENMSESSQGFPTIKSPRDDVPVDNKTKRTPAKRRSTRLATPKASSVSVDCGESSTKQAKKESQEKSSEKTKEKENQEEGESEVVVRTISRMSIHSPTCIEVVSTPESLVDGVVPAQFSPFIVTGRGADRHKNRRSRGNELLDVTSVDHVKTEQVKHFRSLLEKETTRLLELCDKWEKLKTDATEDLPSDVQDLILAAVGQTRLLTRDKFQQFKKLVDKFELGTPDEEKITVDDLTGFWEMVQVTVNSSMNQFKKLDDLQSNNWKEEVKVVRKKAPAVLGPRTNNVRPEALEQSKARLREAMAAARKLKRERMERSRNKSSDKTFDGGFFKIESPKRKTENIVPVQRGPSTPKSPRKSLLQAVLTKSAIRVVKSPSVSKVSDRIRVSLVGRRSSLSFPDEQPSFVSPPPLLNAVPAKSILKSANKSAKRHTVVFHQTVEGKEDNVPRQTPRRSLRFDVGTRFNESPA